MSPLAIEQAAERPAREGAPEGLSFAALYESYAGAVLARCRYLLRQPSEAEDAAQEVFMRALTAREGFRGEAAPFTWLMTITTRHCLNVLRGQRAGWREQIRQGAALRSVGDEGLELREVIRQTLRQFDEETQLAAVLYHVDEMTLEEVAAALERSVPTIRKRLAEFGAAARAQLEGQEPPRV